jgi:hypothetical protein
MTNHLPKLLSAVACALLITLFVAKTSADPGAPNTMPLPADYREWVYLSSGLGMSYSAPASDSDPSFDNVFVSPAAYKAFKATGTWPDKTVLMLEVRHSKSRASINQSGHFQTERTALEAHVKDDRTPGGWAFYGFGNGKTTGALIPKQANCYSCHEQHGTVDTTFVQFYPTLLEIRQAKGLK